MKQHASILFLFFYFLCPMGWADVSSTEWNLKPARLEVGGAFSILHPNRLPDFDEKLTQIGLQVGIPLGNNSLIIEGLYGKSFDSKHYLLSTWYRLIIPTPFFRGYLGAGVHYHHYDPGFDYVGANLGIGFLFEAIKRVNFNLGMKVYVQKKLMVGFGAGFSYLL